MPINKGLLIDISIEIVIVFLFFAVYILLFVEFFSQIRVVMSNLLLIGVYLTFK